MQCFQQALDPIAKQPPLLAKVLHSLGVALNSFGQFKAAVGYHRLAAGLYGKADVSVVTIFDTKARILSWKFYFIFFYLFI